MSFELNQKADYEADYPAEFDLIIEYQKDGLLIDADISASYFKDGRKYTKETITETISHEDAIRLRDYLNKQYSEWVSVDERLPESNGLYLLYLSDGMIVFDKFDADKSSFNNIIKDRLATHWQPLPQPPKEAQDDK